MRNLFMFIKAILRMGYFENNNKRKIKGYVRWIASSIAVSNINNGIYKINVSRGPLLGWDTMHISIFTKKWGLLNYIVRAD